MALGETPQQRLWRDRVESMIGLGAPLLDLMLNAGERLSGLFSPEDSDYYPIRPAGESFELEAARRDAERHTAQPAD